MSDSSEHVTVEAVVYDAERDAVLAAVDGTPVRVTFPMKHPPMDHRLAETVGQVTGLDVAMLEPLDFTAFVMEARGDRQPATPGHRWYPRQDMTAFGPAFSHWATRAHDSRPPWFRPGWLVEATEFLDRAAMANGWRSQDKVVQVKHWSMSCVLRAPTTGGDLYLKAVLPHLAAEPRVIETLARQWPLAVPHILAQEPDNCWWVATDFGGTSGWDLPEHTRAGALPLLVEIQDAMRDRTAELRAVGCPSITADTLAGTVRKILQRDDLWTAPASPRNRFRALRPDERDRLVELEPLLLELCAELASSPLPDTLVHGDFHVGNTVLRDTGFLVYDWSFATISCPLFDLASWLHDATEQEAMTYLKQYLGAWRHVASEEEIIRAWRIAKPLSAVVEVVKFATLADIVGPDYDFNWLPMTYGWVRRLLNAVANDVKVTGWRK